MKNKYLQITGNWYTGTDGMNFLLAKKRLIQDRTKAKEKNLGTERYDIIGYYATLDGLVRGLRRYLSMEVMEECGARNLEEFLQALDRRISRIKELDEAFAEKMIRQILAKHNDSDSE